MSETEIQSPPLGMLQTDSFCEGCGYNLHSQLVTRDERLGMLVCRCPECGRWAPAGQGSMIDRVWINRAATVLVSVWALALIGFFGLCAFLMGVMPYAHLETFTERQFVTLAPKPAPQVWQRVLRHPEPNSEAEQADQASMIVVISLVAIVSFTSGASFSVLIWHGKGHRRLIPFLLPVFAGAFVEMIWVLDPEDALLSGWGTKLVGGYVALEVVCIAAGLFLGRPIARGILRILVPARLLQHLAFLWFVDGKTPPPSAAVGGWVRTERRIETGTAQINH